MDRCRPEPLGLGICMIQVRPWSSCIEVMLCTSRRDQGRCRGAVRVAVPPLGRSPCHQGHRPLCFLFYPSARTYGEFDSPPLVLSVFAGLMLDIGSVLSRYCLI